MRQFIDKFIFSMILLLFVFAVFLQITTVKSTEKLKKDEIERTEQYASKIANLIKMRTKNNMEPQLTSNPELREHLNESLQAFLTKQYRYLFVLQKDIKGNYRFLLDASKEDRADYKELFFPKSSLFDTVYKKQKTKIVEQQEGIEHIWLSLVYPIVHEGKTQGLLVLDLSESYGEHLNNFNTPLLTVVWLMQSSLVISFLLLVFLAFRYYKIRKEQTIDALTSVYKKPYLQEFFGKNNLDNYNIILLDIDELKNINQKFSFKAGNAVLKEFADTLLSALSLGAIAARSGGGEFLIASPKCEDTVKKQTQRIFNTMSEKKYLVANEIQYLTVSMSALSVPNDNISLENIEKLLDEKLFDVKRKGKNGFAILSEKEMGYAHYKSIEYVKEALEEERLTCVYQPIFETDTKRAVKYEALVRLIDKEDTRKLVEPTHFMKLIKGTSQYIKMSKLVLQNVFNTLKKYEDVEISVNIDLDDLDNADTMNLIAQNLYKNRDIANRLTFEIIEDKEVKDYDKLMFYMQQLKAYGSKVALDDFGSGFASYNYLIKLNLDILKIDGSIIQGLKSDPVQARTVIKSIRDLAKSFDNELVAEYISDEKIYNYVKELGIQYSQGFYLGKPKPIEWYMENKKQKE